jgi:hypothetical protein
MMISSHTRFDLPNSNGSLVTTGKQPYCYFTFKKMAFTKVAYFSMLYYHTKFRGSTFHGTIIVGSDTVRGHRWT